MAELVVPTERVLGKFRITDKDGFHCDITNTDYFYGGKYYYREGNDALKDRVDGWVAENKAEWV